LQCIKQLSGEASLDDDDLDDVPSREPLSDKTQQFLKIGQHISEEYHSVEALKAEVKSLKRNLQ
jgi:hypothetical protein